MYLLPRSRSPRSPKLAISNFSESSRVFVPCLRSCPVTLSFSTSESPESTRNFVRALSWEGEETSYLLPRRRLTKVEGDD